MCTECRCGRSAAPGSDAAPNARPRPEALLGWNPTAQAAALAAKSVPPAGHPHHLRFGQGPAQAHAMLVTGGEGRAAWQSWSTWANCLPYVDFDLERAVAPRVYPCPAVILFSAASREGLREWPDWLMTGLRARCVAGARHG
jgi:hypothetical protein